MIRVDSVRRRALKILQINIDNTSNSIRIHKYGYELHKIFRFKIYSTTVS